MIAPKLSQDQKKNAKMKFNEKMCLEAETSNHTGQIMVAMETSHIMIKNL